MDSSQKGSDSKKCLEKPKVKKGRKDNRVKILTPMATASIKLSLTPSLITIKLHTEDQFTSISITR